MCFRLSHTSHWLPYSQIKARSAQIQENVYASIVSSCYGPPSWALAPLMLLFYSDLLNCSHSDQSPIRATEGTAQSHDESVGPLPAREADRRGAQEPPDALRRPDGEEYGRGQNRLKWLIFTRFHVFTVLVVRTRKLDSYFKIIH